MPSSPALLPQAVEGSAELKFKFFKPLRSCYLREPPLTFLNALQIERRVEYLSQAIGALHIEIAAYYSSVYTYLITFLHRVMMTTLNPPLATIKGISGRAWKKLVDAFSSDRRIDYQNHAHPSSLNATLAALPLEALCRALNQILLGKDNVVRLAVTALLARGHLLIEDLPGMGKTTLAEALAHFSGMHYRRVQFTSDLLPSDLIGVSVWSTSTQGFVFHEGPIFTGVLLADEINRAPPKTQSALLEAMEEGQVSIDAETRALPSPFFVIATQNPMEQAGTYPLPESELDRFMFCLSIGYPDASAERCLLLMDDMRTVFSSMQAILSLEQLRALQEKVALVNLSPLVMDYIQALLHQSRSVGWFIHGLSPRAGRAIVKAARAYALLDGRMFVRVDDVQAIFSAVVDHRLKLNAPSLVGPPSALLLNQVAVPV